MRSIAAARHRLAIGDDRERLEARRRQADRVRTDVAGDERAGLRRGRELDAVAIDEQADAARRRATTSRSPRRGSTVSRSTPASAAISRRLSGRSATNSSASRAVSVSSSGGGSSGRRWDDARRGHPARERGSRRPRQVVRRDRLPRSRSSVMRRTPGSRRGALVAGRRARGPGHDRTPRLGLLDHDLAPLHQLEHREERDRDDDTVTHATEEVLQDDSRVPRGAPPG